MRKMKVPKGMAIFTCRSTPLAKRRGVGMIPARDPPNESPSTKGSKYGRQARTRPTGPPSSASPENALVTLASIFSRSASSANSRCLFANSALSLASCAAMNFSNAASNATLAKSSKPSLSRLLAPAPISSPTSPGESASPTTSLTLTVNASGPSMAAELRSAPSNCSARTARRSLALSFSRSWASARSRAASRSNSEASLSPPLAARTVIEVLLLLAGHKDILEP
mmetsp:Transcript_129548/g.336045  ORF Transcript_129548/g.336045 Transcript_129548/m.336045 type:complete len:226 (-) Transcript_129548:201-878(-)